MAQLGIQTIDRDGLKPTFVAASAGGDQFANTGKEFAFVKNGDADAMNVTIETVQTIDGQAVADRVVSIPAGEERLIGGFPFTAYNDNAQSGGNVKLTYDDETLVTVAVLAYNQETFA